MDTLNQICETPKDKKILGFADSVAATMGYQIFHGHDLRPEDVDVDMA